MYHTEKELKNSRLRRTVNLKTIQDIIITAILLYNPNACNIIVGRHFYYYETPNIPTRGELISTGRYISLKSKLYGTIKTYKSKSGLHPPTRNLFKCIDKNY